MGQAESQLTPEDISELKDLSHYSEEEISRFYDQFRKNYPSGRVKKKDLQKYARFFSRLANINWRKLFLSRFYKEIFPNGDPSNIADQFFRVYDADHSGLVDFREFLCAVGVMTRGTETERLRLLFKIYDQDGSGHISHEEYHNVVTVGKPTKKMWKNFSRDGFFALFSPISLAKAQMRFFAFKAFFAKAEIISF